MQGKIISLKTSCRNRYSSHTQPSPFQQAYTLNSFNSPDFVDALTAKYHDTKEINKSITDILSLMNEVNTVFRKIKSKVNELESRIIHELTGFLTNDQKEEELDVLKLAMKKCHHRIIKNCSDPLLIEEFVSLSNKYELTIKRSDTTTTNEKVQEVMRTLSLVNDKLNATIRSCHEMTSFKSQFNASSQTKNIAKKNKPCGRVDVFKLQIEQEVYPKCLTIKQRDQEYFFFLTEQESQSPHNNKAFRIVDSNSHRLLHSMQSPENSGFDIKVIFEQKLFFYAETLNLVFSQGEDYESNPIINIYRTSSKRMSKIAQIPINLLPFQCAAQLSNTYIEALYAQHIFAIACLNEVVLINILTRKCIKEYFYEEEGDIVGLKYLKTINYLVVVFRTKILVYDVSSRYKLFQLRHSLPLNIKGEVQEIYFSGNVLLIQDYELDIIRDRNLTVIDDRTANLFYVYEFDETEVRQYKTVMRDSDCAKNIKSSVCVYNIKIMPQKRELEVYYNIGYGNQAYVEILSYGVKKDKTETALALKKEEPFVHFIRNTLVCDRE